MAKKKTSSKSPKANSTAKKKTAVPFEQALSQLREIVTQLENGNLTLTESLETYEQGVKNLKQCYAALNAAQKRIEILVDLDEEGNLVTRNFDNTPSTQMAEGTRRSETPVEYEDDEEIEEDLDHPDGLF